MNATLASVAIRLDAVEGTLAGLTDAVAGSTDSVDVMDDSMARFLGYIRRHSTFAAEHKAKIDSSNAAAIERHNQRTQQARGYRA